MNRSCDKKGTMFSAETFFIHSRLKTDLFQLLHLSAIKEDADTKKNDKNHKANNQAGVRPWKASRSVRLLLQNQ